MIEAIFNTINDIIINLGTSLGKIFTSIGSLFWTPAAEGTGGTLTVLGIFSLFAVGSGLVMWGFNLLMKFIRFK